MPELPEVQTTVNGLKETVVGLTIADIWSNYDSTYWRGADNIKDKSYFVKFRKELIGRKIVAINRRAKNILIKLDKKGGQKSDIILIHMKMTGHLLYGKYEFSKKHPFSWLPISPESLKDPFNRHIHFVITFTNNKMLTLCDSRKFAKVTLIKGEDFEKTLHLKNLGPEPLESSFTLDLFKKRIVTKPDCKIKRVITDQQIIAGIGNIYADESLWRSGIHPEEKVINIQPKKLRDLFKAIRSTLSKGIDFGGDSMSDYRNIHGEKGKFQEEHLAYQRTGEKCQRKGCRGTITRIALHGRGTHFCDKHQPLSGKK